jgi:hypothetical protein
MTFMTRTPAKNPLAILLVCNNLQSMGHKRKPTAHQRQIRFFTIFFGAVMVLILVALLWLFNRSPGNIH